ncbi:septal ring lytic transglycosylase RlpA family protein [Thiohalomonas denitrificans]|uniref:Endolytic peptidoglycan transglycosylase RlpA n=1 Tax=Thiohalomonas denitrificans TaxID=415747 RepID=A0A1G5Q8W7_9GAMM|nr:septal ring lytic transglycosylase RlpA family protein [Thiohalomonas denitrificans]SCZ58068.1 rare lipoprotein A [Thiohalomonas denitrificans]
MSGQWRIAAALIPMVIGGCSTSVVRDSAPDDTGIDFSRIPDAVPRVEPKSHYGNPESYVVFGKRYRVSDSAEAFVERGLASWYGTKFHGRRTSSGEVYDMYKMTAAHKSLPLPTYVEVTNLNTGRSVVVKVNDRGPFHDDRIIDLSYAAARKLEFTRSGTAPVEIRAIDPTKPTRSIERTQPAMEVRLSDENESTVTVRPATLAAAAPGEIAAIEAAPLATARTAETPAIFLQVGAFSSRDNAERLRQRLADAVSDIVIEPGDAAQQPLYRVRVGPLTSEQEADALADQLVDYGIHSPRVLRD